MQIQLGGQLVVTATEQWRADIRAGRAYASGNWIGAVVGQYGHGQLKNPAGSGKQALVRSIIVSTDTANAVQLARYDTDCTTDDGAGDNLLLGGTAAACHFRTETNVARLGARICWIDIAANAPFYPAPDWFGELGPGKGLVVQSYGANKYLDVMYCWVEL